MGYHRAGFDVVGVDITPQKNYPFAFVQGDALGYCRDHGHEFDAIHASPPCQAYTPLRAVEKRAYPDLVDATRSALTGSGRPWVIENVPGSPLVDPIRLCGAMFPGLRVYRHRLFESSLPLDAPAHPLHLIRATGTQRGRRAHYEAGGFITITGDVGTYCGGAMGIDWMTGNELSQAIPPAYTVCVGRQLLRAVTE
jgi:DNA (cytosine-5)-methyltransferase 1